MGHFDKKNGTIKKKSEKTMERKYIVWWWNFKRKLMLLYMWSTVCCNFLPSSNVRSSFSADKIFSLRNLTFFVWNIFSFCFAVWKVWWFHLHFSRHKHQKPLLCYTHAGHLHSWGMANKSTKFFCGHFSLVIWNRWGKNNANYSYRAKCGGGKKDELWH